MAGTISPADPAYLSELATRARAATDPDALYSVAIAQLGLSPAITAALSPIGQQVFEVAEGVVSNIAGAAAGELADAILNEVSAIIGDDTLAAVEGVVSGIASEIDAIPVVGSIVSFVLSFVSAVEADRAASTAAGEAQCQAVLSRYVIGSGYGGEVTPADIFAPDPTLTAQQIASATTGAVLASDADVWGYWGMPNSALGIAFAAITEDGGPMGAPNGFQGDDTIHHADEVLAEALPNKYMSYEPSESSVGIPKDRRTVYKALRTAMGSQNTDKGKALWPIYLDMLSADWDVHMTGGYANYMISHFWNDGTHEIVESSAEFGWCGSNPQVVCCSAVEWTPIINQIAKIVAAWRSARVAAHFGTAGVLAGVPAASKGPMMRFRFTPEQIAAASAANAAKVNATANAGRASANAGASAAGKAYGESLELARRARTRAKLASKGVPLPAESAANWWNFWAQLEGTY